MRSKTSASLGALVADEANTAAAVTADGRQLASARVANNVSKFARVSQRARRALAAVGLALSVVTFGAVLPNSAQAYQQVYCGGYVAALTDCPSAGLHSWYFNSAATDSGQTVCARMWNAHNGVWRGGPQPCNYIYVDQTFNRTPDDWYNARVFNGTFGVAIRIAGNALA